MRGATAKPDNGATQNGYRVSRDVGAVTVGKETSSDKDGHGPHDPAPDGDGQRSDRAC